MFDLSSSSNVWNFRVQWCLIWIITFDSSVSVVDSKGYVEFNRLSEYRGVSGVVGSVVARIRGARVGQSQEPLNQVVFPA
jgi:hypothetical protein